MRSAYHVYVRVYLQCLLPSHKRILSIFDTFSDKIYNNTLRISRWTFSSNATPQNNHYYNDLLATWQQFVPAESYKSYLQRFVKQRRNLILYNVETLKPAVLLVGNKPECRNLIDSTRSFPFYSLTRRFRATISWIYAKLQALPVWHVWMWPDIGTALDKWILS
jgi:hypothetical protein